jgi:uncharacterized protein YdeI (YjbR/CyaY-like superfamily)
VSPAENYIHQSPEFAKPVFQLLVKWIIETCPNSNEAIKWGFPHFMYHGKILCSFAAFSKHCAINIPTAKFMEDQTLQHTAESEIAMGHFGKITSVKDLPSKKKFVGYLQAAMRIIDAKTKPAKISKAIDNTVPQAPSTLEEALQYEPELQRKFSKMSPSHQKEYLKYINEAKKKTTILKRVAKVVEMLQKK